MIKLIVCDFDDTLVLERSFIESGYVACSSFLSEKIDIKSEKIKEVFWSKFEQSHSNVFDASVEKLLGRKDDKLTQKLIEIYRFHIPQISYCPDVKEFLQELRRRNLHSAIITDGNSQTQQNKLNASGVISDFDKIVITSNFGTDWTKPSIKPFKFLKDFFNVAYEQILYIADNPKKDFAMRASIPICTARIVREGSIYADESYLDNIREQVRISTLSEIWTTQFFKNS